MSEELESLNNDLSGSSSLHTTPAGGVSPQPLWYVVNVRSTMERVIRDNLLKQGIEAYVASQEELHVYKNRTKRMTERIVIDSKVFVHILPEQRLDVLHVHPAVYKFLTDRASSPSVTGYLRYAIIPDAQIQRLQYMLRYSPEPVTFIDRPLHLGDRVRVLRGPLIGFEGDFLRQGSHTYIVVTLDKLGYTQTQIPLSDVELITKS